jgi:hypothetical protein
MTDSASLTIPRPSKLTEVERLALTMLRGDIDLGTRRSGVSSALWLGIALGFILGFAIGALIYLG